MNISESGHLYLSNYFVLDETRKEANRFLEDIAVQFSAIVEEYIKRQNHEFIVFTTYVQKDGGLVDFYYNGSKPFASLEHLGNWNFKIQYIDAMRTTRLSSPTKCKIAGYTYQSKRKQTDEIQRMARLMNLPDPYSELEIELLDRPVEDVINQIAKVFIDRHDDFIRLLEALIAENE